MNVNATSAFLSKMFDVGDLPVSLLTFGNCVIKTGVIKRSLKLYVAYVFYVFFIKIQKDVNIFTFFELLHTFSRTLSQTTQRATNVAVGRWPHNKCPK